MTTPRQQAANQANARRSTGPRTPAGKATVATNALQHGLQAHAVRLCWEDADAFAAFSTALREALQPVGALEELLVDHVIAAQWRLARLAQMEAGVLYHAMTNVAALQAVAPEEPARPFTTTEGLTTADLQARPETLLGSALAYDLSEGAALTNLDRYRRSNERTIADSLTRLQLLQAARTADASADEE